MSVDCEVYVGYTVTLKTDLKSDDFDFFWDFMETHSEYNLHDCKGKVLLVVDGMNGNYARFVFVDECLDMSQRKSNYCVLRNSPIPDDVYNELNKAYKAMYEKDLDKNMIEYALWFHFS